MIKKRKQGRPPARKKKIHRTSIRLTVTQFLDLKSIAAEMKMDGVSSVVRLAIEKLIIQHTPIPEDSCLQSSKNLSSSVTL